MQILFTRSISRASYVWASSQQTFKKTFQTLRHSIFSVTYKHTIYESKEDVEEGSGEEYSSKPYDACQFFPNIFLLDTIP